MSSTNLSSSPQHTLPGADDIHRQRLDNGIVVLARANFNSPSIFLSGFLHAGGIYDPDEKLGLADFTASSLMRGTTSRDFQSIYDALETAGASLSFSTHTHTIGFSGKSLVEDLPMLLDLLSEALRQPSFHKEQIEKVRAKLLTGLALRAQDTSDMAALTFDKIVYAKHPYSRPEDGYPETIQAITREDLIAFHQKHYGPQGMVVSIAGGCQPEKAIEMVAEKLGEWKNSHQPPPAELPPLQPLRETITQRVTIPGKSQADIVLGIPGPSRKSPDYLAASLGNNILGQFGMMGRIGHRVREQAGLAYYAYSSLSGGAGPGPWTVHAGVDPASVDQAIHLIQQEIRRFVSAPVTDEELSDSRSHIIGSLPLSLESNAGVATALLTLERYDLGLDYFRQFADRIKAITAEQILQTVRRYMHPDRLGIAIAGP
jgi:zinc protease